MELLARNSEIYRQIRLLRPAIGAVIRGNVKPLIGYFRYFNLESKLKEKDFGTLSFVLYRYGFNIENQILRYLIQEKSIVIEFYDDSKFYVNHLQDYLHAGLYNETKTFNFINAHIKNTKVFVDVGANIGGYSIRAAKYCKVYVIEPLPRNYKILKINEKLNNVKIISFNIAAGNKNGKIKLYYTQGNWGISSIRYEQIAFMEVEMKTLDEIINEESIDLMKIDVEGAEDLVLEGARNCLKRIKMVIIEYDKLSISNVYKILKEKGFSFKKNFWITIFFLLKMYNNLSLIALCKDA
jgi:FkbM family methyltransferase